MSSLLGRTVDHLRGNRATEASAIAIAAAARVQPAPPADAPPAAVAAAQPEPAPAATPPAEGDDPECKCAQDDPDCDCDDEEMSGEASSAANAARIRERARCAAIFAHPAAVANPQLAGELAFGTRLTRKEARAILAKMPEPAAAAKTDLRTAMATQQPVRLGPGGEAPRDPGAAIAASWDNVLKKK